jgi:hypothetical protein
MDIKDVNTSAFTFDPKQKDFVEKIESASEYFKAELPKGVNRKRYFTYLCLLYDPQSEFRKTISVLPQRKVMCALTAGFELKPPDNKFSEEVEKVLVGEDLNAARMASEFCLIVQGMDMALYTFYARVFVELVAVSHSKGEKIKDIVTVISKVKQETESLEKKILGEENSLQLRKALYLSSKSISLNLQMEDIVERIAKGDDLSEFSPYGNYKPEKIRYAGEPQNE